MIDQEVFETRIAALEELLREKLSVRGRDLSAKLRHAGRRLPKRVQRAGAVLVDAQSRIRHPRLGRMVDGASVERAFSEAVGFLREIDPRERRKNKLLRLISGIVFNLLVLTFLIVLLLRWQGVV